MKKALTCHLLGMFAAFFLASNLSAQRITLEVPNLTPGTALPKRYTSEGKRVSPPLVWRDVPDGTREFALVFESADEPSVHWLLYGIPAKAVSLPEDLPRQDMLSEPSRLAGTIQGITDFKQYGPGYIAPVPAPGKGRQYRFTLYALDAKMGLQPGLDKSSLLLLIQGHVLAKSELIIPCRK